MKTYHKDFCGVTASVTDKVDGTARLVVCDQYGKRLKILSIKTGLLHWQPGVDFVHRR